MFGSGSNRVQCQFFFLKLQEFNVKKIARYTTATLLINSKIWIYLHPSFIYSLQSTISVCRPQALQSPKFLTPHLTTLAIICPCRHWERPLSETSRCWDGKVVTSQRTENRVFSMVRFGLQNSNQLDMYTNALVTNKTLTPHHAIKSAHSSRETSGSSKKRSSSASGSSCGVAWAAGRWWPAFFICRGHAGLPVSLLVIVVVNERSRKKINGCCLSTSEASVALAL